MRLSQLLSSFSHFRIGVDPFIEVKGLSIDTRTLQPGHLFVAIRGTRYDSHKSIGEAVLKGAVALVLEDDSDVPKSFTGAIVKVANSRRAVIELAARFYGQPTEKLFCVGVTGTNGKTSTTYLAEAILNHFGWPTGVMGTINHHFQDKTWPSNLTTPDAIILQRRLRDFLALGAKAVAFEVSSHAIDQGRVDGLPFSCVVWTNLTRDHLDYHQSMENYFRVKERLFSELIAESSDRPVTAIINADDEWGKKLQVASRARQWTYGESRSDFQFQILQMDFSGTRFKLNSPRGVVEVASPMIGRHNVYNTVAAIAVGVAAGASLDTCVTAVKNFTGVPGRLQSIKTERNIHVFVDYAHTDDALRSVLKTLNQIRAERRLNNRIITVFGCGGDRDRGKRPLMMAAAEELSDLVFVTSDNPRTEPPISILHEIVGKLSNRLLNNKVFVEIDRREAIRRAIAAAGPTDVVLIAGKGHEDYQIVGQTKRPFDDAKTAGEFARGM